MKVKLIFVLFVGFFFVPSALAFQLESNKDLDCTGHLMVKENYVWNQASTAKDIVSHLAGAKDFKQIHHNQTFESVDGIARFINEFAATESEVNTIKVVGYTANLQNDQAKAAFSAETGYLITTATNEDSFLVICPWPQNQVKHVVEGALADSTFDVTELQGFERNALVNISGPSVIQQEVRAVQPDGYAGAGIIGAGFILLLPDGLSYTDETTATREWNFYVGTRFSQ